MGTPCLIFFALAFKRLSSTSGFKNPLWITQIGLISSEGNKAQFITLTALLASSKELLFTHIEAMAANQVNPLFREVRSVFQYPILSGVHFMILAGLHFPLRFVRFISLALCFVLVFSIVPISLRYGNQSA